MILDNIEKKYDFTFPKLFKTLWSDGMLDWMNGRTTPFNSDENWAKTIYPLIKDKPPLLLHSGGFDFEMLRAEEILDFQFDELWDIEEHEFIPFAKTDESNVYAFYKNLKVDKEYAIVYIWNDMNETEIIAKSFEDFIFRKMLEAVFDIDKDDLQADYKKSSFEGYKVDLLNDLKSIKPYINETYADILTDVYNRDVRESLFAYGLISKKELVEIIEKYLSFKELDTVFEHEIE